MHFFEKMQKSKNVKTFEILEKKIEKVSIFVSIKN